MPAGPSNMLVLRHGQSEWNAQRRWQGTADPPLTTLGRQQAAATAELLAGLDISFAGVWSSDLRRAETTAAIVARRLALGPVVTDPRLREAHAGEWEGLTPEEIDRDWPGYRTGHQRPPRFEPFPGVVARVVAAIRSIGAASDGGTALVVAHSGVIRSVVRHLGAIDGRIPNMGGVWLTVDPRSSTDSLVLDDLFDPAGIVVSGIDAPGEDPGDQPDDAHADGADQG